MSCPEDSKPPKCKEFRPKSAKETECIEKRAPCGEVESSGHEKRGFLAEFRLPRLIENHGHRQMVVIKSLMPGLVMYSLASLFAMIYVCDWKAVLIYVPYYNGKWAEEDPTKK